jgi:uncharacterized membrane protein
VEEQALGHSWLVQITEPIALALDGVALLKITLGSLGALWRCLRIMLRENQGGHAIRVAWINYSHWLVAALTFQLAADIVESAVAPDWDSVGRLAAVAVIRTFLNYFLERDLGDVRARDATSRTANNA